LRFGLAPMPSNGVMTFMLLPPRKAPRLVLPLGGQIQATRFGYSAAAMLSRRPCMTSCAASMAFTMLW
jgi:hypothetical protein